MINQWSKWGRSKGKVGTAEVECVWCAARRNLRRQRFGLVREPALARRLLPLFYFDLMCEILMLMIRDLEIHSAPVVPVS
jgi:hypothetical protein